MEIKHSIGDRVWVANIDRRENSVECPDCGGTGRLRVTFHDETTVSIECRNCSVGYDPPSGRVRVYDRSPRAEQMTITGFHARRDGVEYRAEIAAQYPYRLLRDEDIFASEDEAMARAAVLAEEYSARDREKIATKEKDHRSWAWNASYHRREIKRAQQSIDHHTAKLNAASLKDKTL